jgi:hypothetical protein
MKLNSKARERSSGSAGAARAPLFRISLLLLVVLLAQACARGTPAEAPSASYVAGQADAQPAESDLELPARLPRCVGDEFTVDFLSAATALNDDTLEEQREQLRDWMWNVTLGRLAKGSSVADVFSGISDEPLWRDDSVAHALRLPSGPTRATTTKAGEVVVLVEASEPGALNASVLEAIDEQALALGRTPSRARVYGFELQPSKAIARVCQVAEYSAQALESKDQGFRRATVRSVAELNGFLAEGVDLLSAACKPQGLEISARTRSRNRAAQFTSEHVAALAQKLNKEYVPPSRFGKSFATLAPDWRTRTSEITSTLQTALLTRRPSELRLSLIGSLKPDVAAFYLRVLDWREANPRVSLTDLVLSAQLQEMFDGKPGFSLDPRFSSAKVSQRLGELLAALPDVQAVKRTLAGWGTAKQVIELYTSTPSTLVPARESLKQAQLALQSTSEPLEDAIYRLEAKLAAYDSTAASLLREVGFQSAEQCSRYDGPLAGTEAGMTFFYTDLSAKFFARDFGRKSPEGEVAGFQSIVNYAASTAACEEPARPSTRIWFGLRDEGYKRESDGAVRFAPTSTRLFAMGSTPGSGEGEAEPNATYRRFIRWWDTNYHAMSSWDPQYEALNQLMKWSVVTQQARLENNDSCLGFLKNAPFRTDHSLSTWAAAKPNLRWHGAIAQIKPTQGGAECLPLLRSDSFLICGRTNRIEGGVSAGSLEQVRAKPLRDKSSMPWLERLAVDNKPAKVNADGVRFDRLVRSGGGELRDVELLGRGPKLTFRAKIDPKAGQVGRDSITSPQWPLTRVEKVVEQDASGLHVTQQDNGLLRGGLSAFGLEKNAVRIELVPGAVQRAKAAGQRVAAKMAKDGAQLADAAKTLAGSQKVFQLADGRVAVEFVDGKASGAYAVMSSGGGNRGPPAQVAFFVGSRDGGRLDAGAGRQPYASPLEVRVLGKAEGERFLAEQQAKLVTVNDTKSQDAVNNFGKAVSEGDFDQARRILKDALPTLSTDRLSDLSGTVERAHALAARRGDTAAADRLAMSIAIEVRRRGAVEVGEADLVTGLPTRILAPSTFPAEASLPPPIHPRGTSLKPNERYVSRLVEMPPGLSRESMFEDASGQRLRVQPARPTGRRPGERVGSAMRITGPRRFSAVVLNCEDNAQGRLPRCTEPAPASEILITTMLIGDTCLDEESDETNEACRREAKRCDRDGDSTLLKDEEIACLKAVRKKFRPETRPQFPL